MDNSGFGNQSIYFPITETTTLNNSGTTSDTYKVRLNGKWHFMKRPKDEFKSHPKYIASFEKEFEIGYALEHTNVVHYVTKGEDENGIYLLTEYVDGKNLTDFIKDNPHYFQKKENAQKFFSQLLSAINYLHSKQILHLDLKPDNILITNINHDVKIVDFGFSYNDCHQFLTAGKTNRFAAPEQLNNGHIDQRTDIYAIGMVMLYIFTGSTDSNMIRNLPYRYRRIARKCLEKIEKRYENISALQEAMNTSNKMVWILFVASMIVLLAVAYFAYHSTEKNGQENIQTQVDTSLVAVPLSNFEEPTFLPETTYTKEPHVKNDTIVVTKIIVAENVKIEEKTVDTSHTKSVVERVDLSTIGKGERILPTPQPVDSSLFDFNDADVAYWNYPFDWCGDKSIGDVIDEKEAANPRKTPEEKVGSNIRYEKMYAQAIADSKILMQEMQEVSDKFIEDIKNGKYSEKKAREFLVDFAEEYDLKQYGCPLCAHNKCAERYPLVSTGFSSTIGASPYKKLFNSLYREMESFVSSYPPFF